LRLALLGFDSETVRHLDRFLLSNEHIRAAINREAQKIGGDSHRWPIFFSATYLKWHFVWSSGPRDQ
jgi:hypothetical protein